MQKSSITSNVIERFIRWYGETFGIEMTNSVIDANCFLGYPCNNRREVTFWVIRLSGVLYRIHAVSRICHVWLFDEIRRKVIVSSFVDNLSLSPAGRPLLVHNILGTPLKCEWIDQYILENILSLLDKTFHDQVTRPPHTLTRSNITATLDCAKTSSTGRQPNSTTPEICKDLSRHHHKIFMKS